MKPLQTASLPRPDTPFLKALDRIIRKATAQEADQRYGSANELREALLKLPGLTPAQRVGRRKLTLALGLSGVLALLLAGGVWYHIQDAPSLPSAPNTATPSKAVISPARPPAREIKGRDGATLHLVPAGRTPAGTLLEDFYLGATLVTNHQFVEFLNAAKGKLTVAEGVVKGENKPWLFLGEVRKGIEPIVYVEGRFRIKDPSLAAHPVVKVTAYGAAAYAATQGRRLPTAAELSLAAASPAGGQTSPAPLPGGDQMESMHEGMVGQPTPKEAPEKEPEYFPVTHYPPNELGIRGLNSPMGSWARLGQDRFAVVEKGGKTKPREAWQGLDWVGFRTAKSLKN